MTVTVNHVYESKKAVLVRVFEVTSNQWVLYRKCDAGGNFLSGTRMAETRERDFERRFPSDHGHV